MQFNAAKSKSGQNSFTKPSTFSKTMSGTVVLEKVSVTIENNFIDK